MESKFPIRVSIERKALSLINTSSLFQERLVGLTIDSTAKFCMSGVKNEYGDEFASLLHNALIEVAVAARTEVDISDSVLEDISEDDAERALKLLSETLGRIRKSNQG